jgi:phosphoserine phosphatase
MSHILTLIAARAHTSLDAATIAACRDAVRGAPAVILSPGEACDIATDGPADMTAVAGALAGRPIDAIATGGVRRKRLLVADMDSTMVVGETLDELAACAESLRPGVQAEIVAITAASMNGEIDFAQALRARVALLRGLDLAALEATWARMRPMGGARTLLATLRARGVRTALVSGGFTAFTGRLAVRLGFDVHRANVLLDDGERLTGQVGEPILDRAAKRRTLHELARADGIAPEATLAVGDGANDLDMLAAAGLGIAFHAKPVVAAAVAARVAHADLRALLFAQGYHAAEFCAVEGGDD